MIKHILSLSALAFLCLGAPSVIAQSSDAKKVVGYTGEVKWVVPHHTETKYDSNGEVAIYESGEKGEGPKKERVQGKLLAKAKVKYTWDGGLHGVEGSYSGSEELPASKPLIFVFKMKVGLDGKQMKIFTEEREITLSPATSKLLRIPSQRFRVQK